jgi:hypothetical protein
MYDALQRSLNDVFDLIRLNSDKKVPNAKL